MRVALAQQEPSGTPIDLAQGGRGVSRHLEAAARCCFSTPAAGLVDDRPETSPG